MMSILSRTGSGTFYGFYLFISFYLDQLIAGRVMFLVVFVCNFVCV